ncbi:hypothetical protein KP509_17G031300 [Ceratopteris richardii]|nr:hypothetical protein KP509_17G031300 [Ceratopteris richardii]
MEHHAADGMSGIHFINTWADIASGKGITQYPFIDRTLLRARDPPTPKFPHIEYAPPPKLLPNISRTCQNSIKSNGVNGVLGHPNEDASALQNHYHDSRHRWSSNLTQGGAVPRIFHLTRAQVVKLRQDAVDEITQTTFSTYEAVSAHVWRCVSKARRLQNEQVTKLYIATDGRSRLMPPLPVGYFGNVIFTATPMAKVDELVSAGLCVGAARIREGLTRMNDEYLRSALDFLELQPNLESLVRGAHTFRSPNLGITSWTRLPIHNCDFGWGRPVFMGPAGIPFEGLVFLLPSPTGDGSLDVSLALSAHDMPDFEELFYSFD